MENKIFEEPFRLHFTSAIENTLAVGWAIVVIIISNFIGISKGVESLDKTQSILIMLGLLGLLIAIFIINVMRWSKTYVKIDEDMISIERNLLVSNKTTISIKSIATVNLEQNLLQRIFGTYKIKLDTNSLTKTSESDVKLVLKKDLAIEFQRTIVKLLNKSEMPIDENEKYDIECDFDKVVQHSILNIPIFAIVYAIFIMFVGFIGFQQDMTETSNSIQKVITILIMIIPAIYSLIIGIFKLYGFKVKRVKDKIYINYGLITKNKYTIPIEKINAVVVRQPVLARIFKRYTVEIINVGMGDAKQESPVLFLMGNKKEIIEQMQRILPEIDIQGATEAQPKRAIVPIAIMSSIITLIFCIPAIIVMPYLVISIVGFGLLSGILIYITRRIGVYDNYIKIVNGIFARNSTIIKYGKIQYITIKKSLITQKLNIEKADINILADMTRIRHSTGYFDKEKFEPISNKIIKVNSKV